MGSLVQALAVLYEALRITLIAIVGGGYIFSSSLVVGSTIPQWQKIFISIAYGITVGVAIFSLFVYWPVG